MRGGPTFRSLSYETYHDDFVSIVLDFVWCRMQSIACVLMSLFVCLLQSVVCVFVCLCVCCGVLCFSTRRGGFPPQSCSHFDGFAFE